MRHHITALLLCAVSALCVHAETTIEQCVEKAMANYPTVRKYGLLEATKEIDLSDINKSWLPRIGIYGQATAQNVVPSFPETLAEVLDKMGQDVAGLGRVQYKAGIEISQTVWDGGASAARREMARARQATQQAATDVELYAVRQRVENLYFAILLTEEQISQCRITHGVLTANLDNLQSMLRNGTATQADADMVEAQLLTLNQTITQARSAASGYRKVLGLFTGESLDAVPLARPEATMPADTAPARPELTLFERRLAQNRVSDRMAEASLMPRVGLFAQAYYGYPGFDYFKSMMKRDLSLNMLAGIKVTWNIDAFYTRKNTSRSILTNARDIEADRETFLLNTRMQSAAQTEAIEGLRKVMADDARITALRANVRKAAESQMANGIIDATALLTKISDENMAKLNTKYHEIQLLQEIYKLKYILDR